MWLSQERGTQLLAQLFTGRHGYRCVSPGGLAVNFGRNLGILFLIGLAFDMAPPAGEDR